MNASAAFPHLLAHDCRKTLADLVQRCFTDLVDVDLPIAPGETKHSCYLNKQYGCGERADPLIVSTVGTLSASSIDV